MRNSVLVSVVIATYNRSNYVQEAILSVFSQTYENYELIVVDDGSVDGTDKIIHTNFDGRLQYYWQPNQGESNARNLGISKANGKYLAFLDSDDKWHPEKLRYQVEFIEKRRRTDRDIALVCSSVWLIDSEGKMLNPKPVGRSKNISKLLIEDFILRPRIYAPPSNALFVTDFVREIGGFDEDISYGEDQALLIKLRKKYKFAYLDRPLTYYRIHNTDQQRFPKKQGIEKKISDSLKITERFLEASDNKEIIAIAHSNIYETAGYWYFVYEDWEQGLNMLLKAWEYRRDCLENKEKIINQISVWGLESAIFHLGNNSTQIINYFREIFYPRLQRTWPNEILNDRSVIRKTWATFCHNLACRADIRKSRAEIKFLSSQALLNRSRFLVSATTWKCLLKGYL